MASSQVQVASAHFGHVLRDHNWRQRYKERESNDNVRAEQQASFEKNLKVLVRDHLHSCIALSDSRDSASGSNEISNNQEKNDHNFRPFSSRDEEAQFEDESSPMARKQSRVVDRWATRHAREIITTTERQTHEAELLALSNSHPVSTVASTFQGESPRATESPRAPSESSVDLPNLPTSSLVQMWREFEAESKQTLGNQSSFNSNTTICIDSRLNSGISNIDSASSVGDPSPRSEVCDSEDERYETPMAQEDSFVDSGSEQNTPSEGLSSSQGRRVSDVAESERIRVSDMVRRLTSTKPIKTHSSMTSSRDETHREQPRLIDPVSERGEQRGFVNAGKSPRVRGRQAMMDLIMRMESERQRELNELVERRAVSRFPHRGRIQSMLKIRFLQREVAAQGRQRQPSAASKLGGLQQGTSILALRQKFSPNRHAGDVHGEESGDDSKSHKQLPNNTTVSEHSGTSCQLRNEEVHHQLVVRVQQESTPPVHHSMPSTSEDLQDEAGQNSDCARQSLVVSNLVPEGSINTATASHDLEGSGVTEEPKLDTQQLVGSTDGTWLGDASHPQRDWRGSVQSWYQDLHENNSEDGGRNVLTDEREPNMQQLAGSTNETWLDDVSHSQREPHTQQLIGYTDEAWPGDVSQPQIDWRGSAQSWSQDLLANNAEGGEDNVVTDEQELGMQQLAGSSDRTWLADGTHQQSDWRGQSWYQNVLENNSEDGEGNAETNEPDTDTEDLEESTDRTWPYNISPAPRDLRRSRQEWYQEVLENSSENVEIRELLQRRSVSNFLASDLKETMDQMIKSCIRRQSHHPENIGGEENRFEHPYLRASDAADYFASTSFNLPLSTSYNLPLPSQLSLQNWYQDHEVRDNSDQVASTSLQSHCEDNLHSTINNPSLEMDLISDLRGHMVQLHNEIYELRKSMESCMDMQNKLQHSIKKDVSAAVYHSVHGKAAELFNWAPVRKGKCCICYEMQVDSLLYRCGHMCTCFKCAHELQWNTGRCPICRAPILDVVRAYSNS